MGNGEWRDKGDKGEGGDKEDEGMFFKIDEIEHWNPTKFQGFALPQLPPLPLLPLLTSSGI